MIPEFVIKNRDAIRRYEQEFFLIFGVALRSYMDPYTGFDICRFDDEFIKSGDDSMEDVVRRKYGTGAVEIIRALI